MNLAWYKPHFRFRVKPFQLLLLVLVHFWKLWSTETNQINYLKSSFDQKIVVFVYHLILKIESKEKKCLISKSSKTHWNKTRDKSKSKSTECIQTVHRISAQPLTRLSTTSRHWINLKNERKNYYQMIFTKHFLILDLFVWNIDI